ncbi:protein of unknown function [Bradyrhizobium vignae]|uniref:Uncharacterized protein n=1 Tax=Bradyrhizobium vignae TaxID=1549949 RepID=A0A2U3Q1Y9_9BRAD|nr:protein of unknown function [Bradyrhizobium vignae]
MRVRPSRKLAEFSGSAASSDMAHPLIVAEATTEHFGAQVGPRVDHGARPYSRIAELVKQAFCMMLAERASVRSNARLPRCRLCPNPHPQSPCRSARRASASAVNSNTARCCGRVGQQLEHSDEAGRDVARDE